ncbi:MAG: hypothetical protein KF729_05750 [Sandaracinaceae bacterium]|nr:hypothetical protein [Sandaracinaceae bacterium]
MALALALSSGCAPAFPSFAGGRTVPVGRSDVLVGAAVRVPVGDLADAPALSQSAPGGVAPAVAVRHGLARDVDLGLEASGLAARAMLRGQLATGMLRLLAGIAPHLGLAHEGGGLWRGGATLPVVLSIDLFSLYEVWIGARVAVEHVGGDADGVGVSLTGLRTGGVVGLGVGFRRLLVLVELGIDHELWTGTVADTSIERSGLVLTPAFAVRLRL